MTKMSPDDSKSKGGLQKPAQKNAANNQAFNTKVKNLYDKILSPEESDFVYEWSNDASPTGKYSNESPIHGDFSPFVDIARGSGLKPNFHQRSYLGSEIGYSSLDYYNRSPSRAAGTVINQDFSRSTPKGSRFTEILDLKQRNIELNDQNKQLKSDMKNIDEFEVVLRKKTKFENFNEKRCDILKACISKQKRYIDNINQAMKLHKKFYKDLKHVLSYLIDLNEKYVRSNVKLSVDSTQKHGALHQVDMAKKALEEIYSDSGSIDNLKLFIQNFNEAYSRVRDVQGKDSEIEKLFDLNKNIENSGDTLAKITNPEANKDISYKYTFPQFIQNYKKIFPIYTVFDEFELKDKGDFSEFINHLVLMAEKVDEVFKKVKNFGVLDHTKFLESADFPEKLTSNAANFKYYFEKSNKSKRLFLNSKSILNLEKSLSSLLSELVTFHQSLVIKKENLSMDSILDLQESLRTNIEDLLLLGVSTDSDLTLNEKIIVVNRDHRQKDSHQLIREIETPSKENLLEIYNHEGEAIKKFEKLQASIKSTLKSSADEAKKLSADSLSNKLNSLSNFMNQIEINYQDLGLISRLKDIELVFRRKFTQATFSNVEYLRKFVTMKMNSVEELCSTVNKCVKDLTQLYDSASVFVKDSKFKTEFPLQFETICKKLNLNVNKILNKPVEVSPDDIYGFEEVFDNEVIKVKNKLDNSEKLLKELDIQIKKDK